MKIKRPTLLCAVLALGLICSPVCSAQEKGAWRATSNTARSITGDIAFSNDKITINYISFTIAQIRTLKPEEMAAAFDGATNGSGNLYRLSIPGSKVFLHHNTLCGSEDTQWIATFSDGHNLQLALFSGPHMPLLTPEAVANTTDLCGTFSYVR